MKTNLRWNNRSIFISFLVAIGLALAASTALVIGGRAGSVGSRPIIQQAPSVSTPIQAENLDVDAHTEVAAHDFGVWGYSTARFTYGGSLRTGIYYSHDSASDLKNYAAANKALLPEVVRLGGQAEIALTFFSPMSPEEFRIWAKQNTLQVRQAQIAVGAPGSSGGTLMISGSKDDPLPESSVVKFPISGMGGVFGLYGTVDAKQLPTIAADPLVFLVDVTPTWVRQNLVQQGVRDAAQSEVDVALPFGWMERLGMVPTPIAFPSPVTTRIPTVLPSAP